MTTPDSSNKLAYGITILGSKVHEAITKEAARLADMPYSRLLSGVRWNDLPSQSPVELDYSSVVPAIGTINKAGTIANDSHYGKYQIWHSMTPYDGTARVYSNGEVKNLIINQAIEWYEKAQSTGDSFHLGKVLHMVQDSYSRSHVVRDENGKIINFQSYNEQDGHAHGLEDKPPIKTVTESNGIQRQVLEDWRTVPGALQALGTSTAILELYQGGANAKELADYLRNHVYQFENEQTQHQPAGGSESKYQKRIAENTETFPPSRQETINTLAIDKPNLAITYAAVSAALVNGHDRFSGMTEANRFAMAEMIRERALRQLVDIPRGNIIVVMNTDAQVRAREYEVS
jgi:hypothetical protein